MDHNLLYTTTLLETIIALLRKEGIDMTTSTAISIEKVLLHTDLTVYNTFSKLKYRIVPIMSRNKEEQEKLYKIFDGLDEKAKVESFIASPPEKFSVIAQERQEPPKDKWYAKLHKTFKSIGYAKSLGYALAAIALVVASYMLLRNRAPHVPLSLYPISTNKQNIVLHDSIEFYSGLNDSTRQRSYSLDWYFADTTIQNQWKVSRQFSDTGSQSVIVYLKNQKGQVVDSASQSYTVLCENPPGVSIEKITGGSSTGTRSAATQYRPLFTNPSNDSDRYKYQWYINDQPISGNRLLSTRLRYNGNVKLHVHWDTPGLHCSTDSLVASLNDAPALSTAVTGDQKLEIKTTKNWNNISLSLLALLLLPLIPAYVIYKLLKDKYPKPPGPHDDTAGIEAPFSINFNNQDHLINPDIGLSRLADILRKRQVSDVNKLNIRKTINNTVRSAGLPQLAFTPITKPADFLIFLETNNPENHQVKLFEYLLDRLRMEQVIFEVYEYSKEPLFLSNEKRNHIRIPIERLASLYPGRTLLIFGDVRPFVLPLKGVIKDWVSTKLAPWEKKILINPYAKNDWDKKEQLLIEAGFTVIPADLEAQYLLDYVLYGQIDKQAHSRFPVLETYPARFLNFQEFDALQNYLSNKYLLNWVCALVVYPYVNWNLTLAIGKAIEKNLQSKGQSIELVNYPNLLKLSRISWLQDGIISDTLKIQMLNYLDNETEALARKVLLEQLDALDYQVTNQSLVKREFDVHKKMNSFLLKTYAHHKPTEEEAAFIQDILSKNQLDQAQDIYLHQGGNTLLKDPYKSTTSISPEGYFKNLVRKSRRLSLTIASIIFILLGVTTYVFLDNNTKLLHWNTIRPSTLSFVINHPGISLQNLVASLTVSNDTKPLSLNSDTLQVNNVLITDTSNSGKLTITSADGNIVAQDSFNLNSNWYTVLVTQPTSIPVIIYYNNRIDSSLAYTIERNLPGQFTATVQQQAFRDTSIHIQYFIAAQKREAELISTNMSQTLNRRIPVIERSGYGDSQQTAPSIAIYVTSPAGCSQIAISALPSALTEIWHEPTNNRLININLPGSIFYYSTGDRNTYGTYRIDEVCQLQNGVYKITARTNRGFNVYFVRNISTQGFELSICQDIYTTKEEARNVHESDCNAFIRMSPYYETNPDQIYLPARPGPLARSEMGKLQRIEASLKRHFSTGRNSTYDYSYMQRSYRNTRFISNSNAPVPDQYLRSINNYLQRLKNGNKQTVTINNANPFQRNYFTLRLMEPPISNNPPQTKPDNQTITPPVTATPGESREELLGTIRFNDYDAPDQKSLEMIRSIARELQYNKTSKIRLEASYLSKSDYDKTATRLRTVRNLFYKEGVSPKDEQVLEKITESVAQRQPQNQIQQKNKRISQTKTPAYNDLGIRVIGINFRLPAAK